MKPASTRRRRLVSGTLGLFAASFGASVIGGVPSAFAQTPGPVPEPVAPASSTAAAAPPEATVTRPLDGDPYANESRPDRPTRAPIMARLMRNRLTWDLNFEGGYGHIFSSPTRGGGFVRPGAGITLVRDPMWLTLRGTYEYSRLSNATIGLQAEAAWFEGGFWVQAGGMMDATKGRRAGFMTAVGFAIFGAELEYRNAEQTGKAWAIYGKLRLPISAIVQFLTL